MKQLFAHITGGTYRMSVTRQQVSPSTMATVRKPEPIVTDATREYERGENVFVNLPYLPQPWRLRVMGRIQGVHDGRLERNVHAVY